MSEEKKPYVTKEAIRQEQAKENMKNWKTTRILDDVASELI